MKTNKLVIQIERPVAEVFNFVLNPDNTSKWVDSIAVEKTSEWPVKLGTVYKNRGSGKWSKYVITKFKKNEMFVMSKTDDSYHVKYTLKAVGDNVTELEYYEWVEKGEIDGPFALEVLKRLKTVLEEK